MSTTTLFEQQTKKGSAKVFEQRFPLWFILHQLIFILLALNAKNSVTITAFRNKHGL